MTGVSFAEKPQKSARALEEECSKHFGEAAACLLGDMLRKTGLREVISQTADTVVVANPSGTKIEMVKMPDGRVCFSLYGIPKPMQYTLESVTDHDSLAKRFGPSSEDHPSIIYVKGSQKEATQINR